MLKFVNEAGVEYPWQRTSTPQMQKRGGTWTSISLFWALELCTSLSSVVVTSHTGPFKFKFKITKIKQNSVPPSCYPHIKCWIAHVAMATVLDSTARL